MHFSQLSLHYMYVCIISSAVLISNDNSICVLSFTKHNMNYYIRYKVMVLMNYEVLLNILLRSSIIGAFKKRCIMLTIADNIGCTNYQKEFRQWYHP